MPAFIEHFEYYVSPLYLLSLLCMIFLIPVWLWDHFRGNLDPEHAWWQQLVATLARTFVCALLTTIIAFGLTSPFIEYPAGEPIYTKDKDGRWQMCVRPIKHEPFAFDGFSHEMGWVSYMKNTPITLVTGEHGQSKKHNLQVNLRISTGDPDCMMHFLNSLPRGQGRRGLDKALDSMISEVISGMKASLTTAEIADRDTRDAYLEKVFFERYRLHAPKSILMELE
ncbi:MAG: hypothetical protein RJB39_197 [Candidatus Parcubacteria bacterium]|jgi:hypothetical protein